MSVTRETARNGATCCGECRRQYQTKFYADPVRQLESRCRRFGITPGAYLLLLLRQGKVCAICESDDWGHKGPMIDHCHSSGRVRGVLCHSCNVGIGHLRDNPATLRSAAAYLEVA
jgi:hypothetical protein